MRAIPALAAFLALLLSSALSHAALREGVPITAVTLQDDHGNPWPEAKRLLPLIEVAPGDRFSREVVRRGIEYLYVTDLFQDIRVEAFPDNGGVRLVYTLLPAVRVQRVIIRGNRILPKDRLREVVGKLEGRILREDEFPQVRLDLFLLYQAEGYFGVRIEFRTEPANRQHRVNLIVEISEGEPTLIEQIVFEGNTVFSSEELLSVMKSRPGRPLRVDQLFDEDRAAIVDLYARSGYPAARMEVVSVRFQDRRAFVTLAGTEGPRVAVRFTGNRAFSRNRLLRNLLIVSEHDVSDAVIESSVDKFRDLYRERGYADVVVEARTTKRPGALDVEFIFTEGPRVRVAEIVFQGNRVFRDKDVRRLMQTGTAGLLASAPYREDVLRRDLDAIRDWYIDAGYLAVEVKKRVDRSADGRDATVTIMITEGPITRVDSVSFDGNAAVPATDLVSLLTLKPGSAFSERALAEDRYRILSFYSARGFLYAEVEARKTVRQQAGTEPAAGTAAPDELRVDVEYHIREDRPVTVGKVILRGNEQTRDQVIEREVMVRTGDRYNYENVLRSQEQIYRLPFIGRARFEPLRPAERGYVKDLLLTVEERPAGVVEFGFGYGDLDLLRGFGQVTHRNLFGRAITASLRLEASDIYERAILNFQQPWLFNLRLENRFSVAWSDEERINADTRDIYYATRKTVVTYGIERAVKPLTYSLIYQYETVNNYNFTAPLPAELPPPDAGRLRISSVTPGVILDRRDDIFNPTSGSLHGVAVKNAMPALGSEVSFTKLTLQSSWFFAASSWLVAAVSARVGIGWPHGDTPLVPLNDRFYLGGGRTVRGYNQDAVGPAAEDGTPLGGESMALGNVELRFPAAGGFGVVLFADAGNVWLDHSIRLGDLRASYGGGIRYTTPVGPFRIDYGQKINRQPGESPGELHFSLGHAF